MAFLAASDVTAAFKGATVVSPYTFPPWKPLRVTDVYVAPGHTPMFRIHALHHLGEWTHATGYCLPPKGARWLHDGWVAAGTRLRLHLAEHVDD